VDARKKAKLDLGSIIRAEFVASDGRRSAGPHYAIVLSTKDEIAREMTVRVAVISSNSTIADAAHRLEVPRFLGLPKKCYIQCSWLATIPVSAINDLHNRKAYGPFLLSIVASVQSFEAGSNEAGSPEPPA
jgi:mRNA-degrading endonuclease toxin of MazEF toxin-antitoxin module